MYRPAELEPEVHPRTLLADHRTRRGTAGLDRVAGLEPTPLPCIGSALPLSYTRLGNIPNILCAKYVWLMSFVKGLSRLSSYEPGGGERRRPARSCRVARGRGPRAVAWCGAVAALSPALPVRPAAPEFVGPRLWPYSQPSVHLAPKLPKVPECLKSGRRGSSRAAAPVRARASGVYPRAVRYHQPAVSRPGRGQANCRPGIARCTRRRGSGRPKGESASCRRWWRE